MAIYKVEDPQGNIREIEGPDGATDEEILEQAKQLFGEAAPPPARTMKSGISPETVAPGTDMASRFKRFMLSSPFGSKTEGTEEIPQHEKVSFGPEASHQAMEEELASRGPMERFSAGIGTGLDKAALRAKQAAVGLTPQEEEGVRFNRQMETAGPSGFVGGVTGNVLMAAPAARAIGAGAGAVGRALPGVARVAQAAAKAAPKTTAAVAPALGGAAFVAGTQPTLPGESEAGQAALGAAGGVLGAGVVAGLPLVLRGAKALLAPFASKSTKIRRETVASLTEAMRADGLNPRQVFEQAAKMADETGKPVTLADVIGDDTAASNTRQLLQEALKTSEGPARASTLRDLTQRATGQRGRVLEDVSQTLGTSKLPRSEVFEELAKTKQTAAKPLYDAAFKNPTPVVDERLTAMMDRPSMAAAFKQVLNKAKERGEKLDVTYTLEPATVPKALLTGVEKNGAFEMFAPTTKNLDTVKKKLYDVESSLFRAGAKDDAMDVATTRRELTKILDEIAPEEYKQARKIWGDYAEMEDSFKQGVTLFKLDPSVIRKTVNEATEAERDAFASGVFANINEMASKEGLDWAGNTLLRDTRKMAQLRAAFGDAPGADEAFDQFRQRLQAESAMMRSSRTYPPTGKSMHAAGMSPGEVVGAASDTVKGNVASMLLRLLKRTTGLGRGMTEGGAGEISRLGFTPANRLGSLLSGPAADPAIAALVSQTAAGMGGRSSIPRDLRVLPPLETLHLRED